jgi:hypothetical protein
MALSGIEMLVSAEVRWFWRGQRRRPVHDWFFKSGLPPGGGQSRIDRYAPQRGKAEISLKRRGNKPEFEGQGARNNARNFGARTAGTAYRNMAQVVLCNSKFGFERRGGGNKDMMAAKIRHFEICSFGDSTRRK